MKKNKQKLFLYPKNEFGQQKFISSTIRPQKISFVCLMNYKNCAKFVANHVKYEQLQQPTQTPQYVVSSSKTIQWKHGDSADMAVLLVSLLIGQGFDAYMIMGTASQQLTKKNQNNQRYIEEKENDISKLIIQNKKTNDDSDNNIFFVPKPKAIESLTEKEKLKRQVALDTRNFLKIYCNDDEPEREDKDDLEGSRIHFWILIKQNQDRQIYQNIFIDVSSGTEWTQDQDLFPFFKVYQIINHQNVWINNDYNKLAKDINFDNFDIDNNWDSIFKNKQQKDIKENQIDQIDQQLKDKEKKNADQLYSEILLDQPMSWAPKIEIKQQDFFDSWKYGQTQVFFRKLQVNTYREYEQSDGLVKKITKFKDFDRLIPIRTTWYYKNRRDNLQKRIIFPQEFRSIDYYSNNTQISFNKDIWPNWKEIETINSVKRIIRFYPLRFNDGLIEREELIGKKTIERYQNRDDRLIYSSVSFEKKNREYKKDSYFFDDRNVGPVVINKMVQKFEKNLLSRSNEQIQKIVIDLIRQKITVQYHLGDREIAQKQFVLYREVFTGISPSLNPSGNNLNLDKTRKIYGLEKECYSKIKYSEMQIDEDFKKFRNKIEDQIEQFKQSNNKDSICEILIKRDFENKKNFKQQDDDDLVDDDFLQQKDIVGLYLKQKGLINKKLDQNTCDGLKKEIIFSHQNRYIERSMIINQRFEEEKNKVITLQNKFKRKANENIDKQDEEKFEEELYNFNLKLGILEQRLFNFQKKAYEKYEELQKKLDEDPRLCVHKQLINK